MSRTDDLAASAEHGRSARERRTATAVALRRFARSGGDTPAAVARSMAAKRIDGTTIPTGTGADARPSTEDAPTGGALRALRTLRGRVDPGASPLDGHAPEASGWERQSNYGFTPDNNLND